jgi:hypothetical protein
MSVYNTLAPVVLEFAARAWVTVPAAVGEVRVRIVRLRNVLSTLPVID